MLALAACGSAPPAPTEMRAATVPPALLTCQDAPALPDTATATQRDVAAFTALLWGAWQDCHGNLIAVRDLLAAQAAVLASQRKQ